MCQETKICNQCKEDLPIKNFYKAKSAPDGYQWACKQCQHKTTKLANKNWYQKYKLQIIKHNKEYAEQGKGVYGIFSNGVCLYIGESGGLVGRLNWHKSNINSPGLDKTKKWRYDAISKHSNIVMGIIEETLNHKKRESYWINKLNPLYNVKP